MTEETKAKKKPVYTAKIKDIIDGTPGFLTIGAGWLNDNGSIYIKWKGPITLDTPVYLFKND